MSQLEPLMADNFIEYASYVILDRAIPDLRDGCKPVQRRILQTLFEMDDGRFHKVANVIGETMKLHPHGEASIGDALVLLANKLYFIERQGNFGDLRTGHRAAAPRYIECRLTKLAKETLFHPELTEFMPSYDGRKDEPVFLPSKLPVLLMLGTDGIAVGMSTKILPHNFTEILNAQIAYLDKKKFQLLPDFPTGGLIDAAEYDDGRGKIRCRAKIEQKDDKTLVIRDLPYATTTESLIASIESAAQKGRVKVSQVHDYTSEHVEIEVVLPRGVYAEEVEPQLYAYTDCEISLSSNLNSIHDEKPQLLGITEIVQILTERLVERMRAELTLDRAKLEDRRHWLTLEQIFIENKVYRLIEKAKTAQAVHDVVWDGMHEYEVLFVRKMTDEDVERLLRIPIRRISAFDIDKSRKELADIEKAIREIDKKLRRIRMTTRKELERLVKEYGKDYPRRTENRSFQTVDKKAVARANVKLTYDAKSGFLGEQIRSGDRSVTISEYDKVLIVSEDGSYRIIGPTDKLFVGKVLYMEPFDEESGKSFTVVYRDKKKFCFAKKISIERFIKDREYELIKNREGKIDALIEKDDPGICQMSFAKKKYQRVNSAKYDLKDLQPTGVTARGTRLAPKAVSRLKVVSR